MGGGQDSAKVDDTGDVSSRIGQLTATQLTGLAMGPSGITYSGLNQLSINLGAGGNTFLIAGTASGTTTTVNSGTGSDTVNVEATGGPTIVITGGGSNANVINAGSKVPTTGGVVDHIQGAMSVTGNGADTMNVDDTGSTIAKTGTLTGSALTGLNMAGITYNGLATLNINLGSGNDLFNVQATSPVTNIDTGPGSNTVNVSSLSGMTGFGRATGTVDTIKGHLTIRGFGNDVMNVDDTDSATAKSGALTATSLTGLNMGSQGITYAGLSILSISLGSHGNTFNINVPANQNLPAATTIDGGLSKLNDLTAHWGGDVNGTLSLLDFESSAITITNNLNGSLSAPFPSAVQSMAVGGSIVTSGVLAVGSLDTMTIGQDLAGQLNVDATLSSLTVHGGTPGTIVAGEIGAIGVYNAFGPVVAQIGESGVERRIEATLPGAPFASAPPPPAAPPVASPSGIAFQYYYEGLLSPVVGSQTPIRKLANPQLTARVANATGNTGPDQFDFSLVTYSDSAKFNLVRLDDNGNSGISGIRNVAVEGDILTAVTQEASAFFVSDTSPAGVYLPQDNLASVAVRDHAPNNMIAAKSIQAVAFGSRTRSNGQLETGAAATGADAAKLLAAGTAIVQAGSINGSTLETFRVPFADLATEQVGFFMDDSPGAGHFDNNNVVLVVQSASTANSTGTGNNVTPSNTARGAVIALIGVAQTIGPGKFDLQNSIIETIALRGDGGSIQTAQTIGSSNNNDRTNASFTPSITSTGPLGDVIVQGPLPNVTAPSIFGSLLPSGPIPATTTIQTTGLRTDPITSAVSQVPADLGRVYVFTTVLANVVTATQVQSNGAGLAGQILCGGNLISQVVSNGATTGVITVQPVAWEPGSGNVGTTFTYPLPSSQVLKLGGFISNGPMTAPSISVGNSGGTINVNGLVQGGILTTYGSVFGNIVINGAMNGPTVSAGNNGAATLNVNGTLQGGIITTYGSVFGDISIHGTMNGPTLSAGNNGTRINVNGTVQGGSITTFGSVTGNIAIGGPMNGPTVSGGMSRTLLKVKGPVQGGTLIKIDGPVQGGSITTYGSATGSIAVGGPVNGPSVPSGVNSGTTVNVPVKGGAILTGGDLGNLTIGGPLGGQVVTIGDMNGAVAINGPVQNGVIATNGSINGALTIGGPLSSGQLLSAGNINGNVTIKGPLQSGAHCLPGLDPRHPENLGGDRQPKCYRLGRLDRRTEWQVIRRQHQWDRGRGGADQFRPDRYDEHGRVLQSERHDGRCRDRCRIYPRACRP